MNFQTRFTMLRNRKSNRQQFLVLASTSPGEFADFMNAVKASAVAAAGASFIASVLRFSDRFILFSSNIGGFAQQDSLMGEAVLNQEKFRSDVWFIQKDFYIVRIFGNNCSDNGNSFMSKGFHFFDIKINFFFRERYQQTTRCLSVIKKGQQIRISVSGCYNTFFKRFPIRSTAPGMM